MTDAGFFRGTSADQDNRFTDKAKKLLKQLKFSDVLNQKVDIKKVNLEIIKPWIQKQITISLGLDDEVVYEYVINQLEQERYPDGKTMQINLTGFLDGKRAREFMDRLWTLLLDAMTTDDGIPQQLVAEKMAEIHKRQEQQSIGGDESNGVTKTETPKNSNVQTNQSTNDNHHNHNQQLQRKSRSKSPNNDQRNRSRSHSKDRDVRRRNDHHRRNNAGNNNDDQKKRSNSRSPRRRSRSRSNSTERKSRKRLDNRSKSRSRSRSPSISNRRQRNAGNRKRSVSRSRSPSFSSPPSRSNRNDNYRPRFIDRRTNRRRFRSPLRRSNSNSPPPFYRRRGGGAPYRPRDQYHHRQQSYRGNRSPQSPRGYQRRRDRSYSRSPPPSQLINSSHQNRHGSPMMNNNIRRPSSPSSRKPMHRSPSPINHSRSISRSPPHNFNTQRQHGFQPPPSSGRNYYHDSQANKSNVPLPSSHHQQPSTLPGSFRERDISNER